ncbi:lipopolysaccharide export system permease protein [Ketogulonicigenium robustum]|uniref:Lipopolysaccharide export system permease protein n=1 Tax=Ketogulonicigenium robustum TaxID=92947 RepID=A0A1W6NZR0_9RHOB|nr:LPS export ABC transporter permease LptF [Ketogulonicigenium robustum]ARO14738.1 lipopolysaccharide export system permease protein [Ketogulonicigenium robustum]
MGRFDRYLLSQLMTLFGFFSLVLIMVYWVNRAVVLFDQLIADGQGVWVFVEFTALSLPAIMKLVLPLSAFVASVYVANRMSGESELVVVQATGFSPWRLARPVLVFGLMVMGLVQVLAHELVPLSNQRLAFRQLEVAQSATARLLQEGEFTTPVTGLTLYVRKIDPGGEMHDLFLSDTLATTLDTVYTATRAYLISTNGIPQLVMLDGTAQSLSRATGRMTVTSFSNFTYDISTLMPGGGPLAPSLRSTTTLQLLHPSDELRALYDDNAIWAEIHDRASEPMLGLIGALMGFATLLLGGFSRFGLTRQIAGAVGLVILIKGIESVGTGAVRSDGALWPLLYLPLVCGLAITALLLTLAGRPGLLRRIKSTLTPWRRAAQ